MDERLVIPHAVILVASAIAAITDTHRGIIPNWLTLPLVVGAPIAHGVVGGLGGLLSSLLGLLVCSLVPLLVYFREGMAGGDVKLFAAIGAIGGIYVGLETQFLALVAASLYALGHLAWRGALLPSLRNAAFLGLNPILPRRLRREIPRELMHRIRLGAAIFLGALIAIAGHHRGLWG